MPTVYERTMQKALKSLCETQGWTRRGWKTAFRAKVKDEPTWNANFDSETRAVIRETTEQPAAWRLVVEDENTPDSVPKWNYAVLILELLVPIDDCTEGIPFENLWWAFDNTSHFYLRVYIFNAAGTVKLYVDETTIHDLKSKEIDQLSS